MREYEINHMITAWQNKQKREQGTVAVMLTQLSNCICAAGGLKQRYKPEDFGAQTKKREMTPEEIEARCRLIFT